MCLLSFKNSNQLKLHVVSLNLVHGLQNVLHSTIPQTSTAPQPTRREFEQTDKYKILPFHRQKQRPSLQKESSNKQVSIRFKSLKL